MMVVMIVMIVTIGRVSRERYRAHGSQPPLPASADSAREREEVRQLKERIAVLERLITDNHGRADLERQIEQLRDR
ncbi:MAG: hypothetical protein DI544_11675 [Sphingomonas taxi]|uniref:Uncharacterized protein n=1 Tax=Sphingomonas taxi TaxID=1549858 RepID=A0A2W5QWQ4_9SPHN|nr:MAG: hypothetical protein DI544_11675 [Sphingomonas taxi]